MACATFAGRFLIAIVASAGFVSICRELTEDASELRESELSASQSRPHEGEGGADWAKHWSLKPLSAPRIPIVRDIQWPRNPADHFILARLEKAGLTPSPEADRRTLLRRLSFDYDHMRPNAWQLSRLRHRQLQS